MAILGMIDIILYSSKICEMWNLIFRILCWSGSALTLIDPDYPVSSVFKKCARFISHCNETSNFSDRVQKSYFPINGKKIHLNYEILPLFEQTNEIEFDFLHYFLNFLVTGTFDFIKHGNPWVLHAYNSITARLSPNPYSNRCNNNIVHLMLIHLLLG